MNSKEVLMDRTAQRTDGLPACLQPAMCCGVNHVSSTLLFPIFLINHVERGETIPRYMGSNKGRTWFDNVLYKGADKMLAQVYVAASEGRSREKIPQTKKAPNPLEAKKSLSMEH